MKAKFASVIRSTSLVVAFAASVFVLTGFCHSEDEPDFSRVPTAKPAIPSTKVEPAPAEIEPEGDIELPEPFVQIVGVLTEHRTTAESNLRTLPFLIERDPTDPATGITLGLKVTQDRLDEVRRQYRDTSDAFNNWIELAQAHLIEK